MTRQLADLETPINTVVYATSGLVRPVIHGLIVRLNCSPNVTFAYPDMQLFAATG